jgi:type II secretion system protein N
MDRRKKLLLSFSALLWALLVFALVIHLFFPYEKVFKVALQNILGGGRATVAMEGLNARPLGIRASKLIVKVDTSGPEIKPFELSDIDVSWSPLSFLRGRIGIRSKALLYDGSLRSTMEGIGLTGVSSPAMHITVKGVNAAELPEGVFPWFKTITGTLDGEITKKTALSTPGRQTGSFRFLLKTGEVRDLKLKGFPRLVVPYREILIEGKIEGTRIDMTRILVDSDLVALKGSGFIDTGDLNQHFTVNLSYTALSDSLPLKGKGTMVVTGSQAAPKVTITTLHSEKEHGKSK